MIKLTENIGDLKAGEITTFGREKDQRLVKKGQAIYVKVYSTCYKSK